MLKKRTKNFNLIFGLILAAIVLLPAFVGLFWTPYDTESMNSVLKMSGPSVAHIFGCDNFGRDIFSRVIGGSGTTLGIAILVILIGASVGIIIGAVSGYYGGVFDAVLMRICDLITAFPSIMLALVIIAVLSPSEKNIIWCLSILFIPSFARITRSEMVKQKNHINSFDNESKSLACPRP